MIEAIRTLFVVVEEGSFNRAALRLRVSQPALSRKIKALENELGGRLLERETSGVKPTRLGYRLLESMGPVLAEYEKALLVVRKEARGSDEELRVGYLISAAQSMLMPALTQLRREYPKLKVKLHDMSPREQIDALNSGMLDIAMIGQEGVVAKGDFHSKKICSLGVCVAVSASDPLAQRVSLGIEELRGRDFIAIDEDQVPGRNQWMTELCRTAGFKPRYVKTIDGITHVLSHIASESAVTLVPNYFKSFPHLDVIYVPISNPHAKWDFLVLWQRGKVPTTVLSFIDALSTLVPKML
jgi:DNA-binding transcriptional LysR family regulator